VNENQRRLRAAGYLFEPSPAGKHFWRQPGTERLLPEDRAFELVRREEVQRLEEAGWLRVEVEEDTYWRRPGSGYLYPRGAAYDVVMRLEGEDEEVAPA
jgi:hypothetical protein